MIIEDIEENLGIVKRELNCKPYAMHMNTKTFNDLYRECMGYTMIPPFPRGRLNYNGIEIWLRSDFENDYIHFVFKENYGRSFYIGETKRKMDKSKEATMNKVTVRDGEEKREKIGVGSIWVQHGSSQAWILASVSDGGVSLISLHEGIRWADSQEVASRYNITEREWSLIQGRMGNFTRIYHIEIEAEREG